MIQIPFIPDNAPLAAEPRPWVNGRLGQFRVEQVYAHTDCGAGYEATAESETSSAFTTLSSSPEATPPFSPASASKASAALVAAEALHGWPGKRPYPAWLCGGASRLAQNFVRPEKHYQTDVY